LAEGQYRITLDVGAGGVVSPAESQIVTIDDTKSFLITANKGYRVLSVSGCDGQATELSGYGYWREITYKVALVSKSCSVTIVFAKSLAYQAADMNPYLAECIDANSATTIEELKTLVCGGNRLRSLSGLDAFVYLESFSLSSSSVQGDIDFSSLTKLKKLTLATNQLLNNIDVSKNANLEEIDFSMSGGKGIDVNSIKLGLENKTSLKKLTFFAFSKNTDVQSSTAIDVTMLPVLEWLDIRNVNVNAIKFSSMNALLKNVYISGLYLNSLDVSSLSNLERLDFSGNSVGFINLGGNTKLVDFNASQNKLVSVLGVDSVLDKTAKLNFLENPLSADTLTFFDKLKNTQGYVNLSY
jgi:hypothetical protein